MTFYEQELRKIVGERYPDATYVGRACYVRLSDMNRAKIQFVTGIVSNQYNALQLTILNRSEGQVDTLRLRFSDLLGTKVTSNPNFRNGVDPHIWDDYGKVSTDSIYKMFAGSSWKISSSLRQVSFISITDKEETIFCTVSSFELQFMIISIS